MSKRYRTLLFFVILGIDLVAVVGNFKIVEYAVKPLIAIWLLAWFVLELRTTPDSLKKWIIFALFFSWLGDVLLMFHRDKEIYFLLGLSSFLLAQVFYVIFYGSILRRERIRVRIAMLLIVLLFFAGMMALLIPHLSSLRPPVIVYAFVISCMLLLAMHAIYSSERGAGMWMMTGAVLFVVSDSMLAIDKFYIHFTGAGFAVMLTYGLAQLFIVQGAIRYINSDQKE